MQAAKLACDEVLKSRAAKYTQAALDVLDLRKELAERDEELAMTSQKVASLQAQLQTPRKYG